MRNKQKIKKICEFCQVEFEVPFNRASKRFCKVEHFHEWLHQEKENNKEIRTCAHPDCDVTFTVERSNPKIFCSPSCSAKTANSNRTKESYERASKTLKKTNEPTKKFWDYTKVSFSKITGVFYNRQIHKNTWHINAKFDSAQRLALMFQFKLGNNKTTIINLENAVNHLRYLYEVEMLSGGEIAKMFSVKDYKNDLIRWLKIAFNIKPRSQLTANNIYYNKLRNKDIAGEKSYRLKAKFNFDIQEYKKLKGYDLIQQFGWFNYLNKKGITRDHMFSVKEGYSKNIPPEHIAHPANCEIMQHNKNASKGKKCSITYEELLERIKNW